MTSLTHMPNELLHRIITSLDNRSDIAILRLVNQHLGLLATEAYFSTVPLYADWYKAKEKYGYRALGSDAYLSTVPCFDRAGVDEHEDWDLKRVPWPNDINYDAHMFKNILESERLKRVVKRVDVYTCNPDCDHCPSWADSVFRRQEKPMLYQKGSRMDDTWYECFNRLPELENLRSVTVVFDRHGFNLHSVNTGVGDVYVVLQDPWMKGGLIHDLFTSLGTQIKHFSARNLQEHPESKKRRSKHPWTPVLSGLKSLRVSLVNEQTDERSGTLKLNTTHSSYARFLKQWLVPARKTLTHLILYSDLPFGWFPKLDLKGVHFQNLHTLCLGQYVFAQDWQIGWILRHKDTLRELYLDHCSILHQIGHAGGKDWFDKNGYPQKVEDPRWRWTYDAEWPQSYTKDQKAELGEAFYEALTVVSYPRRWHEIFEVFADDLSNLRTFKFGSSEQWKFNTWNQFHGCVGMPIMPWEAESSLKNSLFEARYLHYSDWDEKYQVHWEEGGPDREPIPGIRFEGKRWGTDMNDERWTSELDGPPDCMEEDKKALEALLRKLGDNSRL